MPSPFCPKPVSRHKQTNKQTNKQTECTVSASHKSFLKWFKGVGSLKKSNYKFHYTAINAQPLPP